MYFLDAPDETIAGFRPRGRDRRFDRGGGGDGIWNCHVHTNDIGAAVEAGIDAGRPHQIRVTDLMEQVEEERWVRESEVVAEITGVAIDVTPVTTAVVAVGVGPGIKLVPTSLGVQRVIAGGQSMNPSTA